MKTWCNCCSSSYLALSFRAAMFGAAQVVVVAAALPAQLVVGVVYDSDAVIPAPFRAGGKSQNADGQLGLGKRSYKRAFKKERAGDG